MILRREVVPRENALFNRQEHRLRILRARSGRFQAEPGPNVDGKRRSSFRGGEKSRSVWPRSARNSEVAVTTRHSRLPITQPREFEFELSSQGDDVSQCALGCFLPMQHFWLEEILR